MATNIPEEKGEESSFLPEEKPVLDQLLNFVEFKENVSYISEKVTGIKNEIWSDVEIGYSFNECESLLEKQDQLELKCADIYSSFSLLRQEATDAVRKNNSFSKHYRKSCQFLENMCYSLASDLVTRRDLVTSSAKFHSFLLQFRNEIEDVKIFVTAFEEVEDFNIDMDFILKKVHVFIDQICNLAGAVISQGIQLFEIFSKLKVPFRIQEIHRQHVGGWIAFAEVEREFHLKKLDGLVLRIELLWQMKRCNKGVKQSIQWLQELIATVISRSNEVGESAMEADTLFLQLIQCKDAAEESYEIGEKLLQSSFELKKKLNFKNYKSELQKELDEQWKEFSDAFNGVAERLNLSQSFYRSIEKQMNKIEELKATIQSKLKTFGEIRRSFVIQRFKKTWTRIYSAIQKTLHTGRCLLDALKRPVTPNHKALSFLRSTS